MISQTIGISYVLLYLVWKTLEWISIQLIMSGTIIPLIIYDLY